VTGRDTVTDAALARRAAAGDERAFSDLVRRHKEPLYRLLRRYTGDADDAYEAAHEAFIAAWSAIRRYDPNRPFLAWLRTIAINKARDRGRRAAFRRLLFGTDGLEGGRALTEPDPGAAADQVMIERQEMLTLDQAVARLPASLKEALLLTAFEGCTQPEAGEILGVSAKTIETRVYRARKILAQTLDPQLRPKA
jgi:RNA polymerase sigma factor (sigma-70 family)